MTTSFADAAVTPTALLDEVRRSRVAADAAEARILEVAVEWAHAHPVLEGVEGWRITAASAQPLSMVDGTADAIDLDDPEAEDKLGWLGIPPVAWDAPAVFAAANRMSTGAGKALLRDALILCHRLPKVWARVLAGDVAAWRGRRIAQAVLGCPADVVAYLDDELAPVAGSIGVGVLDKKIAAAMLLLDAEGSEADQAGAEDAHEVRFDPTPDIDGSTQLHARGDWKDLHDLDQTLSRVAAALAAGGDDRPLGARRARALGVLADPAQALALLAGRPADHETQAPGKQAVLYLHLTDLALLGLDPLAVNETTGRAVLAQQVRSWLARTDTHVVVKPVIDLDEDLHTESYAVTDRLREQAVLINPTCVFPWCTRPARRCDCDHLEPWDPAPDRGGPTCSHNLAPLCRHHHRLKTLAGWTYHRLEPRVFLWVDPTAHHFLRNRDGTSVVDQQ
ncbi:HNH endonuclease signature motif containing protein [Nocardioides sp.]|uniref:HNH endonuclease signature motif containing protein n=1 Tax=Nocardioides sp. TaxID=35761 RepID=UPI0027213E33|nr:HNH endonuclease signature motif containing protein [Nocardioides sp.]MDO9456547.1 hypothetical protein [Nocardioides sp.]